jgi:crotonobetainyl-CoA:carnitine CoA-transferase CaiB-like acyl-CoA transferase
MGIGSKDRGPLAGIRVFDFTVWAVGPWASLHLGSLGAEVLHVEQPDVDWSQLSAGVPPSINGTSVGYLAWNTNKRGLFLDMRTDEDKRFAHELIKTCDVFLCNMRVGVPERLGLGYEELAQENPGLIYCRATGFGDCGPRTFERGGDGQLQAMTAFWAAQGARGEAAEVYRHYAHLDFSTGNNCASAILLALLARKRTGKGQRVDVTMLDAGATLSLPRFAEHMAGFTPQPQGSSSFVSAPNRAFHCLDQRWIGLSVTSQDEWQRLLRLIDVEELRDAKFATNKKRVSNRDDLEAILVPVFAKRAQSYWVFYLKKAGVPFGIPMDWENLREHRQVIENGYLTELHTPAWGDIWVGGPPWHFSKTPAHMEPAPIPGEATFELQDEIAKLEANEK